jgi:hypothetical protein
VAVKVVQYVDRGRYGRWVDIEGLTNIPNETSSRAREFAVAANQQVGEFRYCVQPDPDPVTDEPGATARQGRTRS